MTPTERAAKWAAKHPDRVRAASRRYYHRNKASYFARRLKKWGLTVQTFEDRLAEQGGGCAICGTTNPRGKGRFHVDHDHSCCPEQQSCGDCVRGLLCNDCNIGLGALKDSAVILQKAINYLEEKTLCV